MTPLAYVTTAKCPDGTFYGAAWRGDHALIGISDALATRGKARAWAGRRLAIWRATPAATSERQNNETI